MLSAQWKNIDWHKAEREVNRLQIQDCQGSSAKDYSAVKRLQYLLTHSFYAKALAVKRVVTNDGRRTPGVDGVLWNYLRRKKMAAALSLTDKRYRDVLSVECISKRRTRRKNVRLGIPRCMTAQYRLFMLALGRWRKQQQMGNPLVSERKMRTGCLRISVQCTISAKHILRKWVLEIDIKGLSLTLSAMILKLAANIPMDKRHILREEQFLKEPGFIYQRRLFHLQGKELSARWYYLSPIPGERGAG